MKRVKHILTGIVLIGTLIAACTPFDELNTDPTRLSNANPGTFLNPVLYGMATYNWDRYNGYTFALMQSKVSTSNTNGVGWYYITDGAGDGSWSTYYKWLNNIEEVYKKAVALNEPNYQAVALTLRSWVYQLLVDSYGNVPMQEACRGDEKLYSPRYDKQADIYQAIIDSLDKANELFVLTTGLKYNPSAEMLYGTSNSASEGILNWKKFCNSLRLRVLLRVSEVEGLNAKEELNKMIAHPDLYPVFESNDEAAMLSISGVAPEEAPMTRPQDFTSYTSLSEFFINNLLDWNDPRLPMFAKKAKNGTVSSYIGIPSGYAVAPSITGSLPNQDICIAPMKLALMTYAEVEFIKAELALKGIAGTDAQAAYEKGVQASIEQWGGVMPEDYFAGSTTQYDGTMERIMLQKFYALFFVDYQQWFEYNRTGLPTMPIGEGVAPGRGMPNRFKYPATQQRTNLKNYQEAKAQMGGDEFSTPLIWQKR